MVSLAERPIRLLGDRLRVRMPAGAEVKARQRDLMGPEESPDEETRVVFDIGEERLVLMAYELFATAGNDFAGELRKCDREASADSKPQKTKLTVERGKFRVYQTSPILLKKSDDTVHVASAWVVDEDGMVLLVSACVNPAAAEDDKAIRNLCSRILNSLEPGKKRLALKGHEERMQVFSNNLVLVAKLPDGWMHTVQRGPDFLVHNLREVGPFRAAGASIGVYVGGHPGYQHKESEAKPEKLRGKVIGEMADWYKLPLGDGVFMEAIRPAKELGPYAKFHVFLYAPSEDALAAVRRITDSMRMDKTPAADGAAKGERP
jgi:hypothetical protein